VQTVAGKKIFNFGIGFYGVDVSAGPSYTTKRQEAVEAQMQLVQSAPETMQFAGDLIVKNMDWPGADALAERYKLMLPPPIQQALQAKEQGQDPKVMAAVMPLKQGLDQAHQQIQMAEQALTEQGQQLQKVQAENDALKSDRQLNSEKIQLEREKAYNERLKLENEARTAGVDPLAAERLRLEHEDEWRKLDADKDVIVAAISAKGSAQTAAIGAQQPVEPDPTDAVEAPEVDTNAAIIAALQNFTAALSRPKVATMPDGRQITVA
jgi:hypothetical protein